MDLDAIRETLFEAMDNQKAADIAANEMTGTLGQQKIMYNNDARGTLYSGQPTWERAQLLTSTESNLAKIENNYLKNKFDVWDKITNTLDQINSYNKAAKAMAKAASNVATGTSDGTSYLDLYNSIYGGD